MLLAVFLLRERHRYRVYRTITEHNVNGGCLGTMPLCPSQGGDIVRAWLNLTRDIATCH